MDYVPESSGNMGETFLIGGQFNGAFPYLEYMSVQGASLWSKYVQNSSLSSVTAIKYLESSTGNRFVVVLFKTNPLSFGSFSFDDIRKNPTIRSTTQSNGLQIT